MNVCVVSFKECWQDKAGRWMSDGGFPRQMAAIGSLFDAMTLLIVGVPERDGGNPLPPAARVVPLPWPAGRDLRRKLSIAAGLSTYLRMIAPEVRAADAVHVPLPGDLSFIGMVLAQAYRKPLLARYGSSWPVNGETTLMNRVTKTWMRLTAGGRNVMVATGDDERPPAPHMHWLFATALTTTEIEALRPNLDRGLSSPPRLVYAGRLSSEKGVHVLLEALGRLRRARRPLPALEIAGDGPERGRLEQQVRRLLPEGVVTFQGQLDRLALSRCMARADISVQPSLTESLCKAWLDAMAHGLPVVASDVGVAARVLGPDGTRGFLVPAGDPAALAATLARICDQPRDWPALRQRCHDYVKSRTLEEWAERAGSFCAVHWGLALVDGKLRPSRP